MITTTKEGISFETKQKIAKDLQQYVQNVAGGSKNKASKMLTKVNLAYVSLMINGLDSPAKWQSISDEAWRNVQKQITPTSDGEWQMVEDTNFSKLDKLIAEAGEYAMTFGVIGDAGWGKSSTSERLKARSTGSGNVYVVECNEFFSKRDFLNALLKAMGVTSTGFYTSAMVGTIVNHARRQERPVIWLDEADKLKDDVLYLFITLYNLLEGKCGLILTGTKYLKKRIEQGAERDKKGYTEIYSRLGRKFIKLEKPSKADLEAIVKGNGVYEPLTVARIVNEVYSDHNSDKRRLKRLVMAEKRKEVANAA